MNIENFPNPQEGEKVGIEEATSFEDLYEMLQILGDVRGTGKNYTPEELIRKIKEVRDDQRDISFITRSHGIRSTVERLLKGDEVYQRIIRTKDTE